VEESENAGPELLLTDRESAMFQRILRASRRDVEKIDIEEEKNLVTIRCKLMIDVLTVDLDKALVMTDDAWAAFFAKHKPLI